MHCHHGTFCHSHQGAWILGDEALLLAGERLQRGTYVERGGGVEWGLREHDRGAGQIPGSKKKILHQIQKVTWILHGTDQAMSMVYWLLL